MKNIEQRLKEKLSDKALGLNDISKDVTLKLNELESYGQESGQVNLSNQTPFSQIYSTAPTLIEKSFDHKRPTKIPKSSAFSGGKRKAKSQSNFGTDYSFDDTKNDHIIQQEHLNQNQTHHASSKSHYSNNTVHSSNSSLSQSENKSLVLLNKVVLDNDIDTVLKDATRNINDKISKHNKLKQEGDEAVNNGSQIKTSEPSLDNKLMEPILKSENSSSHKNNSSHVIKTIAANKRNKENKAQGSNEDVNRNQNVH